jgi:hypothetical protein
MTIRQQMVRQQIVCIGRWIALLSLFVLFAAVPAQAQEEGADERPPIAIEFHIIGLNVDSATSQQLQQVAAASGGQYYDARSEEDLEVAFGQGLGVATALPTVDAEIEPNDRFALANPIAATGQVTGAINPRGDVDFYRLEVVRPGELDVFITDVAPELAIVFRVWDADRRVSTDWQRPLRAGAETTGFADLPRAGLYFLEVRQSGDDAASSQPYTLQTTFTLVAEAWEPNDSPATATPLTLGESILANILPRGDVDWYSVQVNNRGEMRVLIDQVAAELAVVVRVWNPELRVLHDWMRPLREGAETDVFFDLPAPGEYLLEVRNNGDAARSAQPYRLTATYTPVNDAAEPNDSFGAAHPMVAGGSLRETILPRGDVDWFRFEIPGRSRLALTISEVAENLDIAVRVWDGNQRVYYDWIRPLREGAETVGVVNFAVAGTYYLEVRDSGDNARSTQPYLLSTTLTPVVDLHDRNDSIGSADRIFLGTPANGTILPAGDRDWYWVQVPNQARLRVHITSSPAEMALTFRIWNADNRIVLDWQRGLAPGAEVLGEAEIQEPGFYYIEIAASGDRDSATVPYSFMATIE